MCDGTAIRRFRTCSRPNFLKASRRGDTCLLSFSAVFSSPSRCLLSEDPDGLDTPPCRQMRLFFFFYPHKAAWPCFSPSEGRLTPLIRTPSSLSRSPSCCMTASLSLAPSAWTTADWPILTAGQRSREAATDWLMLPR